jgi:2-amino-4-hydroxy-6-hydroxymethyldihydropteridine diphosphokinase
VNNPAFLALGSNLHDRNLYLSLARTRIGEWPETLVVGASSIEETPPFGPEGQDPYLNQMLLIETHLDPDQLLDRAQAIEAESGRERRERWGPRTLDIDIVWFADQGLLGARDGRAVPTPGPGHGGCGTASVGTGPSGPAQSYRARGRVDRGLGHRDAETPWRTRPVGSRCFPARRLARRRSR